MCFNIICNAINRLNSFLVCASSADWLFINETDWVVFYLATDEHFKLAEYLAKRLINVNYELQTVHCQAIYNDILWINRLKIYWNEFLKTIAR